MFLCMHFRERTKSQVYTMTAKKFEVGNEKGPGRGRARGRWEEQMNENGFFLNLTGIKSQTTKTQALLTEDF